MSDHFYGIWNGVKFLVDDSGKRYEAGFGAAALRCVELQALGAVGIMVRKINYVEPFMGGGVSLDINQPCKAREIGGDND